MITVRIKLDSAYKVSSALNEHAYRSSPIICPACPCGSLPSLKSVDFVHGNMKLMIPTLLTRL